jgi:hypothetical protein
VRHLWHLISQEGGDHHLTAIEAGGAPQLLRPTDRPTD